MNTDPFTHTDADYVDPSHHIDAEVFVSTIESEKIRAYLLAMPFKDQLDWTSLFPRTKGMGAAGDVKRRVRMLKSLENRIETLLFPEERVEFVTKGTLNSFAEQYFMGFWAWLINRTLFVFTNYRVILISSDSKGRAKRMMWQIPYQCMRKFGSGMLTGSIGFKLHKGKTLKFAGVPRRDRKLLKTHVRKKIELAHTGSIEFPHHASRDPLCTSCASPVHTKTYTCDACAEEFIKPWVPATMSLVIPGLGDLYLGHTGMAIFEFFGFLFAILIAIGVASGGTTPDIVAGLAVILIANVFDAVVTFHIAGKGVLAKSFAWKPR